MTKELSTHRRCRCQERLFLCFSPMLIFQEDDTLFKFFFLTELSWSLKYHHTYNAGPGKLRWKWIMNFRFFVLLLLCLMLKPKNIGMRLLFLHDKGCFYHSPEILQGLHKKCRILLLYHIKTMKLLLAENQFLHSSYYRPLICTRRSVFSLDL